jgi:hypothetical protein
MIVRGISPQSTEPILGLVRAHARRTALGRLAVVYEITPTPARRPASAVSAAVQTGKVPHEFGPKPQPQGLISLGQALFMDSIIEGGVDGEALPMTMDRGVVLNMQAHMPGALVNLQA